MTITLLQGDCLEIMPTLEAGSIDLIVTSPPYNKTGLRDGKLGHSNLFVADIDYSAYDDNLPEEEYWNWQRALFDEFFRLLKPTGSLFYNHQIRRNNGKAYHPIVELANTKLRFYQEIIWDKCGGFNNNLTYLDLSTERIFWFVKDKPIVNKNPKNRSEIWRVKSTHDESHPAPFPLDIPKNCIQLASNKGYTVLDPFAGSGTSGVACISTERNFIGIELDETYFKIMSKRIADAQQQMRLPLDV
jgi:site-specific DNA-methyltransferase (adenine-specific)